MSLRTFSGVYVFGDSLVDAGNALDLAQVYDFFPFTSLPDGAPSTGRGYYKGRFTDGFTYADLLSNKFIGVPTKPVFPFGYDDPLLGISFGFFSDPNGHNLNFAYGGAQIRQGGEAVPDMDDQTDAFRDAVDGEADGDALHLFTFGANDVHDYVPATGPWRDLESVRASMERDAAEFIEEIRQAIDIGVEHILITGVPDVGLQPYYNGLFDEAQRRAVATEYARMLDDMIQAEIAELRTLRPEAEIIYVSFTEMGDFIFDNLERIYPASAIYPANRSSLVFMDRLHPTAQLHAHAAAYLIDAVNGAPSGEAVRMAQPDLALRGSIASKGEVDRSTFSLAANSTFTFELLGLSSGKLTADAWGTLADPELRIIGPDGSVVASNDDGGLGLDAFLQFTTKAAGNYTVELRGVGVLTGAYLLQADNAAVGNDSYTVRSSSTLVVEGPGGGTDRVYTTVSYQLAKGSAIEVLSTSNTSGTAALNLTGNELAQTIIGNAAANIIDGKGGNDSLHGKGGADVFAFTTALGSGNVDRIGDFSAAEDSIRLENAVFAGLPAGALAAGAFRTGAAAVDADDRIIFDPVARKLYFDPDGTGGAAQVLFATVAGSDLNLTAADFFLV
jgi:phospholipase/lecithinase/hemolysin